MTNFQSHSFLFNVALLSISIVLCSYALRVFYRAEVVAGKKHGVQVEIYAMKAALSFVCKSLGMCCKTSSSSSSSSSFSNPTRSPMGEDDIEAGIPLMEPPSFNRSRARTNTEEFFDATSHEGDLDDVSSLKSLSWDRDEAAPTSMTSPSNAQLAVYLDRKCVDPVTKKVSNAPPGLEITEIPKNFLKTCNGNRKKAMEMFQKHLRWRLEEVRVEEWKREREREREREQEESKRTAARLMTCLHALSLTQPFGCRFAAWPLLCSSSSLLRRG